PAATAVILSEAVAKGLSGGILKLGVHRRANPQAARIEAVRAVIGVFAEALDQLTPNLFHEIAALLAEFLAAAVADRAERRGRGRSPLLLLDVAVLVHLAENIVATVQRLLSRPDRVVISRGLG